MCGCGERLGRHRLFGKGSHYHYFLQKSGNLGMQNSTYSSSPACRRKDIATNFVTELAHCVLRLAWLGP